jgi:16S rRNA (guanine966-N2)-methyltransferase
MRIIAGSMRGRRLVAPAGLATRPTTDRVREAWFSMLGPLHGVVIDLYAGTGALGFEALSRGADSVVFVESARAAQNAILQNADTLGVSERVTLLRAPVERSAAAIRRQGPYSLVLTDPPWTAMEAAARALGALLHADLLESDGRIVLGHPKGRPVDLAPDSGMELVERRAWGDSAASFFRRTSASSEDAGRSRAGEHGSI